MQTKICGNTKKGLRNNIDFRVTSFFRAAIGVPSLGPTAQASGLTPVRTQKVGNAGTVGVITVKSAFHLWIHHAACKN